jgi:hypothetical protein
MQPDPERFRPRDASQADVHSPPAADADAPRSEPRPRPHAPSQAYAPPLYGARNQYNDPQTGNARTGAGDPATIRLSTGYAPPATTARFGRPPLEGRDAPLIHPAAAQASSVTHYGAPVYRTPAYAPEPQQQAQRGLSITALVLGICSFVFAWTLVVVPILGIVFGFIALKREPAGKTMAVVGLIGSALGLLFVLLFYLVPLFAVLMAMVVTAGS